MSAATITVDDITDAAAFAGLEAEWWDLWRRTPSATPFQSPAWLLSWWSHFGPGDLRTVAVRRDGQLVLLAPFYLEDGAYGRRLLPVGISLSDYLDVLVDPAVPDAVSAFVAHLDQAGDWNRLELEELAPTAAALTLPVYPGWAEEAFGQSACPILSLRDAPLASLVPKSKMPTVRLSRNRADRRGAWNIIAAETPETAAAALEALIALHSARWEARGESGLLNDPAVQAFQREAVPRLAAAGLCRLWQLDFDGTVVAVWYELVGRGWVAGYLTGFHPDYEYESPGTLLVAHAIEAAAKRGDAEFHFLRGQEKYKYSWGASDRWNTKRSLIRRPQ